MGILFLMACLSLVFGSSYYICRNVSTNTSLFLLYIGTVSSLTIIYLKIIDVCLKYIY